MDRDYNVMLMRDLKTMVSSHHRSLKHLEEISKELMLPSLINKLLIKEREQKDLDIELNKLGGINLLASSGSCGLSPGDHSIVLLHGDEHSSLSSSGIGLLGVQSGGCNRGGAIPCRGRCWTIGACQSN